MSDLPAGVYETEDGRYVDENGRYVDPTTGNPLTYNPLMGGNSLLDAVMAINETGGIGEQELPYTVGEDGNFYNEDGERLYFWAKPNELGDAEDRENRRDGAMDMAERGSYYGNYYTMAEIEAAWNADEGMGYFKAANPNLTWEQYQAFLTERQGMIQDGTMGNGLLPYSEIADNYGALRDDPNAGYGGDVSLLGDSYAPIDELENPAYADLLSKYGIQTKYMNDDGDIFVFNGSSYDKIFKTDDSIGFTDIMDGVVKGALGAAFGMGLTQILGGFMAPGLADTVSRFVVSQIQGGGGDISVTDALGLAFGGGIPELGSVEDELFDQIVGAVEDTVLNPDNYDPQGGDWDGEVVWRDPNEVDGEDPEFDPDNNDGTYDPDLIDPALPDYIPPADDSSSAGGGGGGGDTAAGEEGAPAEPVDPVDPVDPAEPADPVDPVGDDDVEDKRWVYRDGVWTDGYETIYGPGNEGDQMSDEEMNGAWESGDYSWEEPDESGVGTPDVPGFQMPDFGDFEFPTEVEPTDPADPVIADPTPPSGGGDAGGTGETGGGSGSGDAGDGTGGSEGEGQGGGEGDGDGTGEGDGEGSGSGGGSGAGTGTGTGDGMGPGSGDGFGLEEVGMMAGAGASYQPQWGELFQYTTLTEHQKEALLPQIDAIEKAKGMLA